MSNRLTQLTNVYLNKLKNNTHMKNLLELTAMNDGTKIYLNIEHINYFYDVKERRLDSVGEKIHTQIHLTNNWIKVTETSEQIKAMIFNLKN